MKNSFVAQAAFSLCLFLLLSGVSHASGASPYRKINLNDYVNDAASIQIFDAANVTQSVDLQLLHELDEKAGRIGDLTPFEYHALLKGVRQPIATIAVLKEESNYGYKAKQIKELRLSLENYINSGGIEAIGRLLENPEQRKILGETWQPHVLLQQLTLELLAKSEFEQMGFMKATAGMKSLKPVVQEAYERKCVREERTVELLYQLAHDSNPVGIENENALLLLYHVFHGSLVMSSGCPAHVVNSRHYSIDDNTLPFGLPNVTPSERQMDDNDRLQLRGLKESSDWGKWTASLGRKVGEVVWNVHGYANFDNSYSWNRWGVEVSEEHKANAGILSDSSEVIEAWAVRASATQ